MNKIKINKEAQKYFCKEYLTGVTLGLSLLFAFIAIKIFLGTDFLIVPLTIWVIGYSCRKVAIERTINKFNLRRRK